MVEKHCRKAVFPYALNVEGKGQEFGKFYTSIKSQIQ